MAQKDSEKELKVVSDNQNKAAILPMVISIVCALTAILSAGIAIWQTIEAKSAAQNAYKFALSSERLESCMKMHSLLTISSVLAKSVNLDNKPYKSNKKFMELTEKAYRFVGESRRFKQMTPGPSAEKLWVDASSYQQTLSSMYDDNNKRFTALEIQNHISGLNSIQNSICSEMFGPKGGF